MSQPEIYHTGDVDNKVDILHSIMNRLYDKHCPIDILRVPVDKPYITSLLIKKLKEAVRTACN